MRICRFNQNRLGIVQGNRVHDVSAALDVLPQMAWPIALGDPLIIHLPALREAASRLLEHAPSVALEQVSLYSPITHPSKIMGAPANYRLHVELDTLDPGIDHGVHRKSLQGVKRPVETHGLFLKANSSLIGPAEAMPIVLPDRRTDHEVELALIIGRAGHSIAREHAMDYIAGYCIGLDMTVRGAEDRSQRKSADGYTVLGPWFVTADEIADPHALTLSLSIDGQERQRSSTNAMTVDIPDLIAYASRFYTLLPGDVLLTGTPEGVGPVLPGQRIEAACTGIGAMTIRTIAHAHTALSR